MAETGQVSLSGAYMDLHGTTDAQHASGPAPAVSGGEVLLCLHSLRHSVYIKCRVTF